MTLEFLGFANLFLLARLLMLLKDQSPSRGAWAIVSLLQVIVLAACYRFSIVWMGVALTAICVNAATWRWDERRPRNFARLFVGLVGLIAFSMLFSPAAGMEFRPWVHMSLAGAERWTLLSSLLQAVGTEHAQLRIFGLLIASNEANLAIRAVFDWLDLKPRIRDDDGSAPLEIDQAEYGRGRVIGILERALLYLFVLRGEFGAIGFVLAAKAFTRFRALEDRPFAEYVLIGTLLSSALALLTALVVQRL